MTPRSQPSAASIILKQVRELRRELFLAFIAFLNDKIFPTEKHHD